MRSLLLLFSLATVCQAFNLTVVKNFIDFLTGPTFLKPRPAAKGDNWAVLVAGSEEWYNYRHQADVAHAYNLLVDNGFPRDKIILMMVDDLVNNTQNPFPGRIVNHSKGPNLYKKLKIDYKGNDVTPENFKKVLLGQSTNAGSRRVLNSGPNDNVFVNFVDHGGVGLIGFPRDLILTSVELVDTLKAMHSKKKFAKLVFYLETCESGSMFENLLPSDINVYATTAANASQSSFATYYDEDWGTFLGDEYSVTWMEDSDEHFAQKPTVKETLQDQYQVVKTKVQQSKPQEYGDLAMSRKNLIDQFQASKGSSKTKTKSSKSASASAPANAIEEPPVDSRDTKLYILKRLLGKNGSNRKQLALELEQELSARAEAVKRFEALATLVEGNNHGRNYVNQRVESVRDHVCLSESIKAFHLLCHVMDEHHMKYVGVLAHLCNGGHKPDEILTAIAKNRLCSMNLTL